MVAVHNGRRASARRAGVGLFAGFGLVALVQVIAFAIAVPAAHDPWLRVARYAVLAAETLGVGVVVAVAVAAPIAFLPARRRAVWIGLALVLYALLAWRIGELALGVYIERQAAVVFDSAFERPLRLVYLFGVVLAAPSAFLLGQALQRFPRIRIGVTAVAIGGLAVDEALYRDDYFGPHACGSFVVAILLGMAFARPAYARASRIVQRRRGKIAVLAVLAVAAAALVVPPGQRLRHELFRESCAFAPWVLAKVVWARPEPRPGAPLVASIEPWLHDRVADPPVRPTSPPLLPRRDLMVVLVTIDSTRADAVNDPANAELFPTMTELKRRGTSFVQARSAGSQTSLSLSSLFSGKLFSELSWQPYGRGHTRFRYPYADPTQRFPEVLSEHRVSTASFVGVNFLLNEYAIAKGFGSDRFLATGRQHARAKPIVDAAIRAIERAGRGPHFVYLHLMEPHAPYDRGRKDGTAYERYLSEISVADHEIGRILRVLERRYLNRYVFMVSADHGESFDEHDTTEHSKTLYEELLHVPLVVRTPIATPPVVAERVTLLDLGPTVLDLLGFELPARFLGRSLVPLLEGRDVTLGRPLLAEGRLRRALTTPDGLKVIDDIRRKTVEAYDLEKDPNELVNVFGDDPRADSALASLRAFFEKNQLLPAEETPYKQ